MSEVELLSGREIAIREMNSLRGRLCTVIESAHLPEKQERALVSLIKNLSYQNQSVIAELLEKIDENGERRFSYTQEKLSDEGTIRT